LRFETGGGLAFSTRRMTLTPALYVSSTGLDVLCATICLDFSDAVEKGKMTWSVASKDIPDKSESRAMTRNWVE
jgi:hypothetical protein